MVAPVDNEPAVAPVPPIAVPELGLPGVPVADGGGEEFQKAARGLVASLGDDARHHDAVCRGG